MERDSVRDTPLLPNGAAEPPRRRAIRLVVVVSVVTIGTSAQFGFGTGSLNNLDKLVGEEMSRWQWGLVVSGFGLGGLVASFFVAYLSAAFGRKTVLLATNALVLISSALIMAGGSTWPVLMLGRVCIGLVAGSTPPPASDENSTRRKKSGAVP